MWNTQWSKLSKNELPILLKQDITVLREEDNQMYSRNSTDKVVLLGLEYSAQSHVFLLLYICIYTRPQFHRFLFI